jgi:hypothetical protein
MILSSMLFLSMLTNPVPVITVGVDPAFWDAAIAGGDVWYPAADFEYIEGCGNGQVNVCWGDPALQGPGQLAGYDPHTGIIHVWSAVDFSPARACHEFGHVLGLWWYGPNGELVPYHRYDDLSCMSDNIRADGTLSVPYPDAADFEALGVVFPVPPLHDGTGGPFFDGKGNDSE